MYGSHRASTRWLWGVGGSGLSRRQGGPCRTLRITQAGLGRTLAHNPTHNLARILCGCERSGDWPYSNSYRPDGRHVWLPSATSDNRAVPRRQRSSFFVAGRGSQRSNKFYFKSRATPPPPAPPQGPSPPPSAQWPGGGARPFSRRVIGTLGLQ
jgi:hypothetical protein